MAVELPGSEEETAARTLIAQAGDALTQRRPAIPPTFVAQLYARGGGVLAVPDRENRGKHDPR